MIINHWILRYQTFSEKALNVAFGDIINATPRHMLCCARAVVWRSYAKHHLCQAGPKDRVVDL